MVCIETVSFSIEINGHKFDMWKPKRGIRQGNPLSLCIFIICLNSLISKFVDGHKSAHFDGFQINKHTCHLSQSFVLRMIASYFAKIILNP